MFGEDAVCSWIVAGVCFPKRDIQRWIHLVNLELNGGHCNGMTITSLRLFKELDSHPGKLDTYSLGKNDQILATWNGTAHSFTVRRYISYFQVLQYTDSVSKEINDALFLKTPKEVLERLRSAMLSKERDFTTLVMYSERPNTPETPGHAVTPYRIEDKGNGVYWVWVYDSNRPYDNNRPNESNRYVEINTTNNTWSYNWDRDCTWNGDADSHSLGALPISVYDKRPNGWSFEKLQTWLEGQGHLLITDSRGRRVGYIDDHFVDEVPEAFGIVHPRYTDTPSEPIYYLPINETYTILVDGRTLTQTETVAVTQFGPGYAASVDDVKLEPTSQNWLTIAPDGTQLVYQSSDHGEATLTLALDSASESNQFQIRDADIGVGQSVVLTVDTSNGQLVFDNSQAGGGLYNLEITRVSAAGEQKFSYADVVISAVDTHYVDYGAWDGSGPMMLHIDHGSDGTVDEVVTLQAKISVSPAETSMRVGEVAETQIMASNVTDFYGADFTITFNPTVVQVEDADPHMPGVQIAVGALFDGQDHFVARNWVDNTAGVIEFVASLRDPAPPINGSGAVAAITWRGVNPGISDLVLEQVKLSDRGSNPIDHSRENGTVEVTDGTGSLISGTVLLQGRTDHSGTVVFATEGLCPDLVHVTDVAIPIPGLPSTATDVEGRFEITPYPGQTYQCLQAVQGGYLVAQASSPTGNLGMLTLPGGDVTGDDVINIFDLALVAARYGSDDPSADVNADGQVGIFDLTITAGNYGRRGPVTDWQ
jgi:hypothetical protein